MLLPQRWLDVDVELDLVAVRIFDIQAMRYRVVGGPNDRHTMLLACTDGFAELVVCLADFQAEVVHADARVLWNRRCVRTDREKQQLMMRSSGRECRAKL